MVDQRLRASQRLDFSIICERTLDLCLHRIQITQKDVCFRLQGMLWILTDPFREDLASKLILPHTKVGHASAEACLLIINTPRITLDQTIKGNQRILKIPSKQVGHARPVINAIHKRAVREFFNPIREVLQNRFSLTGNKPSMPQGMGHLRSDWLVWKPMQKLVR